MPTGDPTFMQLVMQRTNLMPQLDIIGMIFGMMFASRSMGWVAHFMWEVLYGLVYDYGSQACGPSHTS